MQEGVTIEQACFTGATGSCTGYAGFTALYVDVTVESTSYPTGFELNGWSNTGDWYQSMILLNWCATGFSVGNEAFDNGGTSVYPSSGGAGCYGDLTISAGDSIQLGLHVIQSGTGAGDVCFTAADLTTGQSPYSNCIAQPDPGTAPQNNYFAFGGSNGFFTGPMTEILGGNVSTCRTLGQMPAITYQFAKGAYITQALPWSDEWNPGLSLTCYSTIPLASWNFAANDPTNYITDASGHSANGPHWENLANVSSSSTTSTWEFETDATLAVPTPSHSSMDVGQYSSIQFHDNFDPRSLDGTSTFLGWSWTPPVSGCTQPNSDPDTLNCGLSAFPGVATVIFNISERGGYDLVSPPLTLTIYAVPTIESVALSRSSLDIGQVTTFSLFVSGGAGGLTAQWSNVPSGCAAGISTAFTCSPTVTGTFDVSARVTDSNGVTSNSSSATLTVLSDPTIAPVVISPKSGELDVGQTLTLTSTASGGTGVYTYAWTGVPNGCTATNSSVITCAPTSSGTFDLNALVTDSAGFSASTTNATVNVYADPTLRISPSQVSLTEGQPLDLTVNISGGVAPYSISWTDLPQGCISADSPVIACIPSSTGSQTIWVHVTDSAGYAVNATVKVTVSASFFGTSLSPTLGWALITAIVLAVAVGAAVILVRRRRRRVGGSRRAPPSPPASVR